MHACVPDRSTQPPYTQARDCMLVSLLSTFDGKDLTAKVVLEWK